MGKKVTKVIFRVFTGEMATEGNNLIALFPDEVADMQGNITSYQHVGQHGAASIKHCLKNSRAALPHEYKALASELRQIGYKLDITKS